MLRLKLSQNSFMATLSRLCISSSSCSSSSLLQPYTPTCTRLIPLHWRDTHHPHLKVSMRAAHISPSSSSSPSLPSYAQDEEWDLQDLSSDPWFRSNADSLNSDGSAENPQSSSWPEPDEEWYKAQAEDEEWFRREEGFYEARILQQEEWGRPPAGARPDAQPDFLALSESSLFSQCRMDTFRASGPGGQHRNKTDSGVRLTHLPTGVVAQAVDDRSQHKNRAVAMGRLRLLIAAKVRRPLKLQGYKPPPELLKLLPAEPGKKSSGDKIGVHHPDFAKGVQALLDLLAASKGYVFYAAAVLRVSPSALSKILTADKTVLQATNELLVSKGQKPFK